MRRSPLAVLRPRAVRAAAAPWRLAGLLTVAVPALASPAAPVGAPPDPLTGFVREVVDELRRYAVDPVPAARVLAGGLDGLARARLGARPPSPPKPGDGTGDEDTQTVRFAAALAAAGAKPRPGPGDPVLAAALSGMAASLPAGARQGSEYLPPGPPAPAGSTGSLGLELGLRDSAVTVVRPLPEGPAERAGVRPGDVLVSLDGRPFAGLDLSEAVARLRGPLGGRAALVVARPGHDRPLRLRLSREAIRAPDLGLALLDGVAYLRIERFGEATAAKVRTGLRSAAAKSGGAPRGVVLDLRDDAGGVLEAAARVAGDFLPAGATVATLRGRTQADNAVFRAGGDLVEGLPVVVVVNQRTSAGAEIVAGALQDHRRAVVLGARTAGAGTVRTALAVRPTGGTFMVVSSRIVLPSGRGLDGAGVTPNAPIARPGEPWPKPPGPDGVPDAAATAPLRPDLAGIAGRLGSEIALAPPPGEPEPDRSRPERDYEVRQAVRLVGLMREGRR